MTINEFLKALKIQDRIKKLYKLRNKLKQKS